MRDLPHDIIKRVFPLVVLDSKGKVLERLATKTFLQTNISPCLIPLSNKTMKGMLICFLLSGIMASAQVTKKIVVYVG
jgi:hypothetical protein